MALVCVSNRLHKHILIHLFFSAKSTKNSIKSDKNLLTLDDNVGMDDFLSLTLQTLCNAKSAFVFSRIHSRVSSVVRSSIMITLSFSSKLADR